MNDKQITQIKSCSKCGNQLIYERREGSSYQGKIDQRTMRRTYFCVDCNSDCEVVWKELHHWTHALRSDELGVDQEFPLIKFDEKTGENRFTSPYCWPYYKIESKVLRMVADMMGGMPMSFDSNGRLVKNES